MKKEIYIMVSKAKADFWRPILAWARQSAEKESTQKLADSILRKIRNIKDWEQISLTKPEYDLVCFVSEEFTAPEPEKQLEFPGMLGGTIDWKRQ